MKKKQRVAAAVLAFALAAGIGCAGYVMLARAMVDESNSVHINAGEIENSTLIIGSHLIYLGSMNDSIYQAALASAEQSAQYNWYYKSELADGVWYDITDAQSLADITTDGVPVADSVIEALNMTHHTRSDGITYDLVTDTSINIYDIADPYDLEGMEELNPIKVQYDNLVANEEPSETDLRNIQLVRDFYAEERSNEVTEQCDEEMTALQVYYEILVQDGEDKARSDRVQELMEQIDAARRTEILGVLQDTALDQLIRQINRNHIYEPPIQAMAEGDGEGEGEEGEEEESNTLEGFFVDNNLLSAVSEALNNVQESYNEYSAKRLSEGTTVLSAAEYRAATLLIGYAKDRNFANCDEQVTWLMYLDNIKDGQIVEGEGELEYLDGILLPRADSAYQSSLSSGAGDEYGALPSTAAGATRKKVLKDQKTDTEAVRAELQFLISAAVQRMEPQEGINLLTERLDGIASLRSGIRSDAYAEFADSSVDAHEEWLSEELSALRKQLGGGVVDSLQSKKSELETERRAALDNNNLAEEKRLAAEIGALDASISEESERLTAILNSDTATPAEKAAARAGLGSGTAAAAISDLLSAAKEGLADGDYDSVADALSGIGALAEGSPQSALNAMKELYTDIQAGKGLLDGSDTAMSALDTLGSQVEDLAAEHADALTGTLTDDNLATLLAAHFETGGSGEDGAGEGSGSGLGTSSANPFAEVFAGLSDENKAAALAGLDRYATQAGSSAAAKQVAALSAVEFSSGNRHIFRQYAAVPGKEYEPLDSLARVVGYRYIFNDSNKQVILQKGADYYRFEAFRVTVERAGGEAEELPEAAGFLSTVYIPEEYGQREFGCEVQYLSGTEYGVLLTEEGVQAADEFFDYLMEMGGA